MELSAAQQKYPPAEVNLGMLYLRGFAPTADHAKALSWLHKAAKRHFAPAEFALGTIYEYKARQETDKSLVEAIYWYRRAAERGYAPAQNNPRKPLGQRYWRELDTETLRRPTRERSPDVPVKFTTMEATLGQGVALAGLGLALGLAGAIAGTRLLTTMLFQVRPNDPVVYLAITILLGVVTLLASYVPARRTSKVDPLTALRQE